MKRTPLKRKTPLRSTKRIGKPKKKSAYARRKRAEQEWWDYLHSSPCIVNALTSLRRLNVIPGVIVNEPDRQTHDDWLEVFRYLNDTPCDGEIEADHDSRGRGLNRKSKDLTCIPLCNKHHGDRTNRIGLNGSAFAVFSREVMRDFAALAIAYTHANARARGVEIPEC